MDSSVTKKITSPYFYRGVTGRRDSDAPFIQLINREIHESPNREEPFWVSLEFALSPRLQAELTLAIAEAGWEIEAAGTTPAERFNDPPLPRWCLSYPKETK